MGEGDSKMSRAVGIDLGTTLSSVAQVHEAGEPVVIDAEAQR